MSLIGVQDVYSYEAQSFETNATVPPSSYENTTEYNLTVVRVAGDVLCTPARRGRASTHGRSVPLRFVQRVG